MIRYESRVLFIISTCDDNIIKESANIHVVPVESLFCIDFKAGTTFILVVFISAIRHVPFYTMLSFLFYFFFWDGRVSLSEIGFFRHVASTMSSLLTFFFGAHVDSSLLYRYRHLSLPRYFLSYFSLSFVVSTSSNCILFSFLSLSLLFFCILSSWYLIEQFL